WAKELIGPIVFLRDGGLFIEAGSLYDMLDTAMANTHAIRSVAWQKVVSSLRTLARWWPRFNSIGRARVEVAHHYDLSRRFFELFLDENMQYSCAYFHHKKVGLDEAQQAKMHRIASKLLLHPGQRVLDIGCGWGGLALYLARHTGVEVVGITLSKEQHKVAEERAAATGLSDLVTFKVQDYRLENTTYDRIVSVAMYEHVGVKNYSKFFGAIERLLEPNGIALLHSSGRRDGPGTTNQWERKYIFPGGYAPALSEVVPVVERTSLWITDIEILRLHYAETIKCWRENFQRNRTEIAQIYDERFCRMWDFFLTASELSFRHNFYMVSQMQLSRGIQSVPLTRDYIV
ncbi:MAG: class I SAM-dependent methyltransferase, partial [Gammaproteobacteria bacterium]